MKRLFRMNSSLTLHVELVGRRRCDSTVEFGCADDLAVVIYLLGNDGQDGYYLTVALHAWFVHLFSLLSVPSELRHVGWAGVDEPTGDQVGLIFHRFGERAYQRFSSLICGLKGRGTADQC